MNKRKTIFKAGSYAIDIADMRQHGDVIRSIWSDGEDEAPRAQKLDDFYLSNPAGPPTVFLLWSEEDLRYVGALCAAPRNFYSGDTQLTGMVFADLYVEKKHRTLGPSCMLLRQARAYLLGSADFVYGFMNPMATLVGRRIGLTFRNPAITLLFPIDVKHHTNQRVPGFFGAITGHVLQLLFSAIIEIGSWITKVSYDKTHVELDQLEIDVQHVSSYRQGTVIGSRSERFLKWRLETYPAAKLSHYAIHDRKGRTAGFIAYSFRAGGRVNIEDLIAISTPALLALLIGFLKTIKNSGNVSLQAILLSESRESTLLRRLGFKKGGELTLFFDWADQNVSGFSSKSVYLTSADNDV